jgi:LysM repeat protein
VTRTAVRCRLAGALVAAVLLVACDGDNKSTTPTTPLPTVPPDAGDVSETTTTLPSVYIVKAGQSLTAIAKMFGVSVKDLISVNGLTDPNHIEEGQRLTIPPPTTTTTTIEP